MLNYLRTGQVTKNKIIDQSRTPQNEQNQ